MLKPPPCDNDYTHVTFFFFKQKTAYEIMPSLVGSEMCIRDSISSGARSVSNLLLAVILAYSCK